MADDLLHDDGKGQRDHGQVETGDTDGGNAHQQTGRSAEQCGHHHRKWQGNAFGQKPGVAIGPDRDEGGMSQ